MRINNVKEFFEHIQLIHTVYKQDDRHMLRALRDLYKTSKLEYKDFFIEVISHTNRVKCLRCTETYEQYNFHIEKVTEELFSKYPNGHSNYQYIQLDIFNQFYESKGDRKI